MEPPNKFKGHVEGSNTNSLVFTCPLYIIIEIKAVLISEVLNV